MTLWREFLRKYLVIDFEPWDWNLTRAKNTKKLYSNDHNHPSEILFDPCILPDINKKRQLQKLHLKIKGSSSKHQFRYSLYLSFEAKNSSEYTETNHCPFFRCSCQTWNPCETIRSRNLWSNGKWMGSSSLARCWLSLPISSNKGMYLNLET